MFRDHRILYVLAAIGWVGIVLGLIWFALM
jgi:hypothetical protein